VNNIMKGRTGLIRLEGSESCIDVGLSVAFAFVFRSLGGAVGLVDLDA
jgi:hypothetical protein